MLISKLGAGSYSRRFRRDSEGLFILFIYILQLPAYSGAHAIRSLGCKVAELYMPMVRMHNDLSSYQSGQGSPPRDTEGQGYHP